MSEEGQTDVRMKTAVEEWTQCRSEIQSFNGLLVTLRLHGTAIMTGVIGAAAAGLHVHLEAASLVLTFGAFPLLFLLWMLDVRYSTFVVELATRSRQLEQRFSDADAPAHRIHNVYQSFPARQRHLVAILYGVYLVIVAALLLTVVWTKYPSGIPYVSVFLIVVLILVLTWMPQVRLLYHRALRRW